MRAVARHLPIALLISLAAPGLPAATATDLGALAFEGTLHEPDDLSGVTRVGEQLLIVSDEGARVQRLAPQGEASYVLRASPIQLVDGDVELDLEGLAHADSVVYAVGSHSLKRKRIKSGKSQRENRRRLTTLEAAEERARLFRFRLDEQGALSGEVASISLRRLFASDPLLGPFTRIPGKENGLEVEGLAADGERLYLGFRSPILRSGLVPLVVTRFDRPQSYELRLVDLGGRGIRGLARVRDGLLVLAGFEKRRTGEFKVYLWDAVDRTPGSDAPPSRFHGLGTIPTPDGAKAEGIALLAENEASYEVLIVYDDAPAGSPRRFRLRRPEGSLSGSGLAGAKHQP